MGITEVLDEATAEKQNIAGSISQVFSVGLVAGLAFYTGIAVSAL